MVELAKQAQTLYHTIGTPTMENYKAIIHGNMIKNCQITVEGIDLADKSF